MTNLAQAKGEHPRGATKPHGPGIKSEPLSPTPPYQPPRAFLKSHWRRKKCSPRASRENHRDNSPPGINEEPLEDKELFATGIWKEPQR